MGWKGLEPFFRNALEQAGFSKLPHWLQTVIEISLFLLFAEIVGRIIA